MSPTKLNAAIIIVSTTASKNPSSDASGNPLTEIFTANSNTESTSWEVVARRIVSDDHAEIQGALKTLLEGPTMLNLIVTTGGTGFAVTDITPEAVKPFLQKEAPGLVHAMLTASLNITPFSMMSRPVAGVSGSTIIVTLPGSPKGATENLGALIKLLPHACIQAAGIQSSRELHSGGVESLERQAGVHKHGKHSSKSDTSHGSHHHDHHHHHGHGHGHGHAIPKAHTSSESRANRLGDAVTRRHRESPYPMVTVKEASDMIARETQLKGIVEAQVNEDLVGYVLAEDIIAAENVPAYKASIVDGYAVVHSDGKGTYPVVSVSHAAPGSIPPLSSGQVARITTGAPLPPGATAVVMVEDTVLKSMTEDEKEEAEVEILAVKMKDGENVREVGSDVMKGDVVLEKGDIISAIGGEVGLLASVGRAWVKVYDKATVGVLSTGDEVVHHYREGELQLGEIRDSNRPALLSAIKAQGFSTVDLGIARDKAGALQSTLIEALQTVDVIITTGGVSMGELDLLKPTIEQSLNGTIHFGRVEMKPGKPTTFATVESPKKKLIFALPGNPASALVTLHLFVLPSLRKSQGYEHYDFPRVRVTVDEDMGLDPRPEFRRAFVRFDMVDGRLHASGTGGQRSSRIGSTHGANAVLVMPALKEVGKKRRELGCIPRGETVEAILWGQIGCA
ncbi:hypothetical protein L873DRAFT_1768435 [Choiromyces venosus 120613-1]|uniref:MoaB/Mog domain-containing protein n=1 Tax=Choiromyces venosus 120613-1 TaxID=1336337 RepID=A0A3N4JQK4_9PEZI|nr:hypothetical protein L873DRAFT_1768435 [Choiromyces venosus 120613-1]